MFTRGIVMMLGLLAPAVSVYAQDSVRVNIPFAFNVDGRKLPPSKYEISPVSSQNREVLVIRNLDDLSRTMLVHTNADEAMGSPKLVFDRYSENYFLSGIVTQNGSYDLPPSKAEQKLAQKVPLHAEIAAEGK
jgi:hypothetical protein